VDVIINAKLSKVEYNIESTLVIDEQHIISKSLSNVSMVDELVVAPRQHPSILSANDVFAYLNALSQFVFTLTFKEKTRVVLLSREGYFEITHDSERPFIVIKPELKGQYTVHVILENPPIEQNKMAGRLKLQMRNGDFLHIRAPKATLKIKTINTNIC